MIGCSLTPIKEEAVRVPSESFETAEKGWWYARIRMHWPEHSDPSWYLDSMVAHLVVSPILDEKRPQIELWRFHRRALRDGAGHQFSFIFYSTPHAAAEIYRALETNSILKKLIAEGKVENLILENTAEIKRPNIEDTSDPVWDEIIQKSWPHYIMGVSEMWLDMVKRIVEHNKGKTDASEEFYEYVHNTVTFLWKKEGNHAFLHHLNGLFAYRPMVVTERKLMTF